MTSGVFDPETNTFTVDYYAERTFGIQVKPQEGEKFILHNIHKSNECLGSSYCVIHNPSDHHMREWALNWRGDRGLMERICPHGGGHPDPDTVGDGVHGCDGCCTPGGYESLNGTARDSKASIAP